MSFSEICILGVLTVLFLTLQPSEPKDDWNDFEDEERVMYRMMSMEKLLKPETIVRK